MTDLSPPLIFDRDSAERGVVELVTVDTVDGVGAVRVWQLTCDRAITLGLGLAIRGWRAKMAGRT